MGDESNRKKSVVRRTKKHGNLAQNRELRQSMHDINVNFKDLSVEDERRKPTHKPLERAASLNREPHVTVQPKNSREILRQYVASIHKVDVDKIDETERTSSDFNSDEFPIHKAIQDNAIKDLALYLLKTEDAQIEQKNPVGQTPLMYAVWVGDTDVVKLLITFGASVNVSDNFGVSALRYAVEAGDFEISSLLISHGANAETVQNGF